MGLLLTIIALVLMYCASRLVDWKFGNRTSPDGYKTDWVVMNQDLANGMSQMDVKKKFNRGGYDIKDTKNIK